MKHTITTTISQTDYELLDSGNNRKLERFGDIVLDRPDPQALWKPMLSEQEWNNAHAKFSADEKGAWQFFKKVPEKWEVKIGDFSFWIHLGSFKHTGVFPEHLANWDWIQNVLKGATPEMNVLNLFGYTGGATLAAAKAGASVVHLDGSKSAINWAKDNAQSSGLAEKPIRWILDDALVFLRREVKRGRLYHGIIMDPPAYGHGPDGEMWKIEKDFLTLLDLCKQVLAPDAKFVLINGYASGYSSIAYQNCLSSLMKDLKGEIEIGELSIQETKHKRLLPAGIFARWSGNR